MSIAELEARIDTPPPDSPKDGALTREARRSRRHRPRRAVTEQTARMAKAIRDPRPRLPTDHPRPLTRGQCPSSRPCPFVGCRYHTYLDIGLSGDNVKLNFPDVAATALEELPATCALDVAELDGITLEGVGAVMNLTRERVRQVEVIALAKLEAHQELIRIRAEGVEMAQAHIPCVDGEQLT